jgi:O-antigen ligase
VGLVAGAAVLLGAAAVALPPAAKVVLLAAGAIGLTGWGTWRLLAPALRCARGWTRAPSGGALVEVVLLWVFVEASWAGVWRGPAGLRLADLLLVGLGLYGLVGIRTAPPAVRRILAVLAGAFGLVLLGALLPALSGGAVGADVEALARASFAMLFIPAVIVRFVQSERRLQAVVLATVASVAVASIAAVATQVTDVWLLPFDDDFFGSRSYGLSNHPALFGIAAAAALPLGVGLLATAHGGIRIAAGLCIPLLLLGMVLSASRAPLAAGAVAVLALLFALRVGGRRGRVELVLVLVAMAGVAGAVFPERLARLSDPSAQRSALTRVEVVTTAIDDVATSPIVGEGARMIKGEGQLEPSDAYIAGTPAALRVGGGTGDEGAGAHNLVLQTWRSLGLLGLVGVSMAILAGLLSGIRAARRSPQRRTRVLALATLASLGVVLACLMLFDAVFERQLWLTVGLLCAVGVAGSAWTADSAGREADDRESEAPGEPAVSRAPA